MPASRTPSLDRVQRLRKIARGSRLPPQKTDVIHRFEEIIGGRTYEIEVTPVSNRWRAQIRRTPGMLTALMPFYGRTPDEAAQQLSKWLTLANRRHASTPTATRTL
jgi:hypothetical protein